MMRERASSACFFEVVAAADIGAAVLVFLPSGQHRTAGVRRPHPALDLLPGGVGEEGLLLRLGGRLRRLRAGLLLVRLYGARRTLSRRHLYGALVSRLHLGGEEGGHPLVAGHL